MTTGMGIIRRRGIVVLGCAFAAAGAAAVPPTGGYDYGAHDRSVYDISTVLQLSLLLVAGVGLLFTDRVVRRVSAVLGIAAGAQLAGTGVVAWRRWHTSAGFGVRAGNELMLRALAPGVAVAGVAAASMCGWSLWCSRSRRRSAVASDIVDRAWLPVVGAIVAAGVVVAVPLAMGHDVGAGTTQLGAHALMYGLPWALVLLVGALVDRTCALAAAMVVVVSSAPLLDAILMIPATRPAAGFVVAVLGGCSVAIVALFDRPALHHVS